MHTEPAEQRSGERGGRPSRRCTRWTTRGRGHEDDTRRDRRNSLLKFDGVHVKCEYLNPSGSVKDRLARYIIEKAEEAGLLKKGGTIVEASSGNTGTAVSMVGAVKGYKVTIFIAEGLSEERYKMMKAFGADVRTVPRIGRISPCKGRAPWERKRAISM